MQIQHLYPFTVSPSEWLSLRLLHGIQYGIQQVQRNHHQNLRQGIAALEFPGNSPRMTLEFKRGWLWVDAVALDVAGMTQAAQRIGIRIEIAQMGAFPHVRIDEEYLG